MTVCAALTEQGSRMRFDVLPKPRGEAEAAAPRVLTMGLGDEIFAVEGGMVRQIIDAILATRVAGTPAHLPGVINLRGNMIPLADIRFIARWNDDLIIVPDLERILN